MDLTNWTITYKPGWDEHFQKFDRSIQMEILKKLDHMKQPLVARGLHNSHYQVEGVGQYRIAFYQNNKTKTKEIHFVGNHKQYEDWYRSQF